YMCGFAGTSNVLAGKMFGIPVSGTVAHSFIQAFNSEMDAFRAFASTFPGPVTLLIDTYDTEQGARHAAKVGRELAKHGGRLLAVRIDSGDLIGESRRVRQILDEEGLPDVQIIVSGGLDEYDLKPIVASGAPIDAFGVGTSLATSDDAPSLEMAYKLVEFEGRPRLKLSEGKVSLAGSKQVWRRRGPDGLFAGDLIGTADEPPPGPDYEPLLVPVIEHGEARPLPTLRELRERHREEMAHLPPDLHRLRGQAPYPVDLTPALRERQQATIELVRARESR
ncbi:MAG: nicotinate phosphoribosyltransferase, partial [Thermomicrobiaceae bacterium]|nr:nicotinate phosphoribosyltransferase [Thermomicrobiaceae bacterium]